METPGSWETALGLGPGETITKTWHGRHDYDLSIGGPRPRNRRGRSNGELTLTNRRLLFIAEPDVDAFVKQVDCPLNGLIDVSIHAGSWGFGKKYVIIGSGVGNIRLLLDDVDEASVEGFRAVLESASGKSLIPRS